MDSTNIHLLGTGTGNCTQNENMSGKCIALFKIFVLKKKKKIPACLMDIFGLMLAPTEIFLRLALSDAFMHTPSSPSVKDVFLNL